LRDAFIRALTEMAEKDPRVVLITGDLGFGVLTDFAKRFPNQFVNAGVAEQNMTMIACGMALEGFKVYTYSIANFTTLRCLEQLRNDVCYHDADVTAVSVGGGFSYGQLGMSHFAIEDLAILRALPNMTVVAPTEVWETEELTRQLAARKGPTYLRLDKGKGGTSPDPAQLLKLGKIRRTREGADVTLIATGAILSEAMGAAATLAGQGVQARVLAVHTIKPLDTEEIVRAARETGGIVTVEEHTIVGGLGGAVAEVCLDAGVSPGFFRRVGLKDAFPTIVGTQEYLRAAYKLDAPAIVDVVNEARRKA
jgi:transketolase